MQTFNLDLSIKKIVPLLYAKQRDVGAKIHVVLTDNKEPYTVPNDVQFSVWFSGKSGSGNYTEIDGKSAFAVEGNTITVELIHQMLNNAGEHLMCLVMNGADGKQQGLWNIPYYVEAVPGADSEAATAYYNAFLDAQKKAEEASERAEAAADRAESAGGGSAKGAVLYTPQDLTEEQKAQARENIGITADPNIDEQYFTITDDGIVSLKPEYRGACPSNRASAFPFAVSDNGATKNGSKNAYLPKTLVIPQVVGEIAVVSLAPGMFLQNQVIESVTLPSIVTEIPDRFLDNAWNLANLYNTEQVITIGTSAFQKTRIRSANFPNLTSLGNNAFVYCPFLIFADIGNVTSIGQYAFFMNTRLSRLKGGAGVKTIGTVAFAKTYRLHNVESLAQATSIGQNAFMRSRLNYDWQSLKNNGCTFGTDATSLQLNPTDFWSSCTPTACENPVPTLLSQLDTRWGSRVIANGLAYGDHGCAWMTIMHIYCALNNLTLTHVEQFEAICNSINPNIIGKFDRTAEKTVEILRDLGLNAELVNIKTSNAQTSLQKIYDSVANGGYVHAILGGAVNNNPFGYHAAMIYGVNAKGELLYADSSDQAAFEMTDGQSVIKYPMAIQNSVKIYDDSVQPFIIVSK